MILPKWLFLLDSGHGHPGLAYPIVQTDSRPRFKAAFAFAIGGNIPMILIHRRSSAEMTP